MKNSVVIKGNKYGIVVVIKDNADFSNVKTEITEKIKESSKFFGNTSSAISFEGKKLSNEEQQEIIDIISKNSELNIVCVVDDEYEERFKQVIEQHEQVQQAQSMAQSDMGTGAAIAGVTGGQFYRGTLRSGQVLESDSSVVILGDVNPGARIVSGGSVVILGSLKGTVYAGMVGDESAFVVALDMHPQQIRINETIARCGDKPKKNAKLETKIAYVDDGNIYIEPLSKEVLNDIKL